MAEEKSAQQRMEEGFARLDREENERLANKFSEEKPDAGKAEAEEKAVKGSTD